MYILDKNSKAWQQEDETQKKSSLNIKLVLFFCLSYFLILFCYLSVEFFVIQESKLPLRMCNSLKTSIIYSVIIIIIG